MAAKKKAAKPKKYKDCGCVTKMNEMLEKQNGELETLHFIFKGITLPKISVLKKKPRLQIQPPHLLPNYCPFCGVKYEGIS